MRRTRKTSLTAPHVLARIRAEIDIAHPSTSPYEQRLAKIRTMQREFREKPVGGRLVPVKRMAYWFTASAFDRQAKVIETLLELVEDLAAENHRLSVEAARAIGDSETSEDE